MQKTSHLAGALSVTGTALLLLMVVMLGLLGGQPVALAQTSPTTTETGVGAAQAEPEALGGTTVVYMPLALTAVQKTPFGVESNPLLSQDPTVSAYTEALNGTWIRLGSRVSWAELQPTEGGAIQWSRLTAFEQELRNLRAAGITPIISVSYSPRWATIRPTTCGAIRSDKFNAFGQFMAQVVTRYSAPEYNVLYWELGNEPDIDPDLVSQDDLYGCWGNSDDPYYGGEHYGRMLRTVVPAMRAANPNIKLFIGGLLLDNPNTAPGQPANFFEGILRAGAAPYFDYVAFHTHFSFYASNIDYSGNTGGAWGSRGGAARGKPAFLREVMGRYGVSKPLFLDESTIRCPPAYTLCAGPSEQFFQAQAAHIPRMVVRSLHSGVTGFLWYTINGPGWDDSGLLDDNRNPRPAYFAYKNLIQRLRPATAVPQTVSYGSGIEAYRFSKGNHVVDVLWSVNGTTIPVTIPQNKFIEGYYQQGTEIVPIPSGSNYQFNVGFDAIYLHRHP